MCISYNIIVYCFIWAGPDAQEALPILRLYHVMSYDSIVYYSIVYDIIAARLPLHQHPAQQELQCQVSCRQE